MAPRSESRTDVALHSPTYRRSWAFGLKVRDEQACVPCFIGLGGTNGGTEKRRMGAAPRDLRRTNWRCK